MRITYPKAIQESEEDLTRLEQRLRGQKAADRVRMLRLLKSGTVTSLCERDTSRPCKTHVITWSASREFVTRTASRCGGCSRNIGSSGRPGGDDTRKRVQSNRLPLKKLRDPDQAPKAFASRGFRVMPALV
jgi:hypothetical protein